MFLNTFFLARAAVCYMFVVIIIIVFGRIFFVQYFFFRESLLRLVSGKKHGHDLRTDNKQTCVLKMAFSEHTLV